MTDDPQLPPTFSPLQKWKFSFNVVVATVALFSIAAMVNYLSSRHYHRFYAKDDAFRKVSPLTEKVLGSLTNTVKVIVYFNRREPLFNSVSRLLKEYQLICPRLEVEFVDYRYPGRAEAIRAQYNLSGGGDANRVIFDSNGRWQVISEKELSEYDYSGAFQGKEIRRIAFKGEQLFTSAIFSVTSQAQPKVYFLQGHDEHDPENESDQFGYRKFARVLEENNAQIGLLKTLVGVDIPADCQLLIIAGPTGSFHPEEIDKIEKYLGQNGRVFLLFNSAALNRPTGLEKILSQWDVEAGLNVVRDAAQAKAGNPALVVITQFTNHPIVNPLGRASLSLITPRSISRRSKAEKPELPKVVELAFTGPEGMAVGKIRDGRGEVERSGAIPVIAAVEKGGIQGIRADQGVARMVIAGDSYFLANYTIDLGANIDFAALAVNWLLNRDLLLAEIPPRATREYRISLTEAQMRLWEWTLLGGLPGGVLLIGGLVWLKRRV